MFSKKSRSLMFIAACFLHCSPFILSLVLLDKPQNIRTNKTTMGKVDSM